MKIWLNEITGIADAITTLYFSKRSWTRELETKIRDACDIVNDRRGVYTPKISVDTPEITEAVNFYNKQMDTLLKFGQKHITMLRFIDFSITVEGLHRAGQDDWDSHAQRFNNRIIRTSTREPGFSYELSDFYKDKVIPTDIALATIGLETPDSIEVDGITYVKAVNGYIREDMKDMPDVRRGLYMLSIPSNFIFKVNLTEWAHVFKERNSDGNANPEVKQLCETIASMMERYQPKFTRNLFRRIEN